MTQNSNDDIHNRGNIRKSNQPWKTTSFDNKRCQRNQNTPR